MRLSAEAGAAPAVWIAAFCGGLAWWLGLSFGPNAPAMLRASATNAGLWGGFADVWLAVLTLGAPALGSRGVGGS